MPRFEINQQFDSLEGKSLLVKESEWTVVIENLKIHFIRKSTVGKATVSGEFDIIYLRYLYNIYKIPFSVTFFPEIRHWSINIKEKNLKGSNFIIKGHMEMTEISDTLSKSSESRISEYEVYQKSHEKLLNDFEQLLDPQTCCFADITLKCGDVSLPAHKNILSVRSPVFKAMFANPMKESIKNEVDISDIDISIVRTLLTYMYTGKISSDFTNQSAIDLMVAADKYQVEDLKAVCSDVLKDTVSLQNVLSILVLGDMIDDDLKSFAMDYISNRADEFSTLENTGEWRNLEREKPHLSIDVLTSMVKSLNTKYKK